MVTKEKLLWVVDFLRHLSEMHIYVDEIAEEVGFDLSYDDFKECIQILENLVEKEFKDKED